MSGKRYPYFKGLGKRKIKNWSLRGAIQSIMKRSHGNIERSMDKEFAKLKA